MLYLSAGVALFARELTIKVTELLVLSPSQLHSFSRAQVALAYRAKVGGMDFRVLTVSGRHFSIAIAFSSCLRVTVSTLAFSWLNPSFCSRSPSGHRRSVELSTFLTWGKCKYTWLIDRWVSLRKHAWIFGSQNEIKADCDTTTAHPGSLWLSQRFLKIFAFQAPLSAILRIPIHIFNGDR